MAVPCPFLPKSVRVPVIAPTPVQHLAFVFVELHEVHVQPLLKPVQIPLDAILSVYHINCTTEFGMVC